MMVEAVQALAAGRRFVPLDVTRNLQDRALCEERQRLDALTERECEILRLLAAGHTLAEIATLLCVSSKTVANYQTSIRQKLGCDNAMQLMRIAIACGLADAQPGGAPRHDGNRSCTPCREKLPRRAAHRVANFSLLP
jgi:DNA-binding NarL/FixJ family response regulator